MADFCRKCATELGLPPDLTIEVLKLEQGTGGWELCESCGYIFIANQGGKEVVYRAENAADTVLGRG
jgi:hypothetical protein